jgi:hypothetical protein
VINKKIKISLHTRPLSLAFAKTMNNDEPVEVEATSAILTAAAFWIGAECQSVNDMFMACKAKSTDPADCAETGLAVSHCVNNLYY